MAFREKRWTHTEGPVSRVVGLGCSMLRITSRFADHLCYRGWRSETNAEGSGSRFEGVGCRVWVGCLLIGVCSLGFGFWGLGFGVEGLRLRVEG